MRSAKRSLSLWLLVLVAVTFSCTTDLPTGPEPSPSASLIGALLKPTGLLNCRPLPYVRNSATIGPLGGEIKLGPHKLLVPPGALLQPVTITGDAPSGTVNLVRFWPEGLTFTVPATLTMSYANCNLLGKLLPKRIAHVDERLNILGYLLSLDLPLLKKVNGKLDHFSSYAVAW